MGPVILAVHGVRSSGEWGDALFDRLKADPRFPDIVYDTLDYPVLPAAIGWLLTWLPAARHWMTTWMLRRLLDFQHRYPDRPMLIIVHSYGSWLVWHALRIGIIKGTPVTVRTLILVGAVLRMQEDWTPVAGSRLQHVFNHISSNDLVVRHAPMPFGQSGRLGFLAPRPASVENIGDWHLGHHGYWSSPEFYKTLLNELGA